jgi:1-acyl-sn-glycerol-3-phosphate acyltransferase
MTLALIARSTLYVLIQIVFTLVFSFISLLTFPLPLTGRYAIISWWARTMVALARRLCGIDYRVIGTEHIPREPCVIISKHQSAWETFVFQLIFPPQVWVLKRELLWVPFFGWGLAMLAPIAIDRGSGARALRQMVEQGADRLRRGFCVVIFPEGTRTAPGQRGTYHAGGALLSVKTGAFALPVAHNAGRCWPRNALMKRPGMITISIGPAMAPQGLSAAELNRRLEDWIESEMPRLDARET